MNKLDWHVIDWDKAKKIALTYNADNITDEEVDLAWNNLCEENNIDPENLPIDFEWEHIYHCNFPKDSYNKIYLCLCEDNSYAVCRFDSENITPCFWDKYDNQYLEPIAYADITEEKPLE